MMQTQYAFSKGASFPRGVSATDAGRAIEQLISIHGEARPEHLVDAAKDKRHPLHRCFEWDDSAAATSYRLDQARHVLRSVVITREDKPDQVVRAFVNVGREGGWESIDVVLSSPDKRQILLAQAAAELRALENKYATLIELNPVRRAIADFVALAQAAQPKPTKQPKAKQAAKRRLTKTEPALTTA